ncbi:hypothetical protein LZ32DRAFT_684176 [Colletotrichum eremochloae]|nr:hypothetical protein LZ32DRAFT_684176 [Colletotrichum eremochloae]
MLGISQPSRSKATHVASPSHHLPSDVRDEAIPCEVPVLIVGGGTACLLTTYMLYRHGGRSSNEKFPQRLAPPKAHALCGWTLESCRQSVILQTSSAVSGLRGARPTAYIS